MANEEDFRPDWTLPPGATIADLLIRRRVDVAELAQRLETSQPETNRLLNGSHPITPTTAAKLEQIFGAPASFWLTREARYRADLLRLSATAPTQRSVDWMKSLPVADMVKYGWLPKESSTATKVTACLQFFGVSDVDTWDRRYRPMLATTAFKTTAAYASESGSVAAWVRQGEIIAGRIACGDWNPTGFRESLTAIRGLTRQSDPERFVPELVKRCAANGVAVAVVRSPDGCRASGLTRFISEEKALLLLSFRHRWHDHFWFAFFHEAAHLLLHSQNAIFVEGISEQTQLEQEANEFAEQTLIPIDSRRLLGSIANDHVAIMRFAQKLNISRGIVVGQLHHHGHLHPSRMNFLRRKIAWEDSTL